MAQMWPHAAQRQYCEALVVSVALTFSEPHFSHGGAGMIGFGMSGID